jgi:HSP20 family molecular chaperone IbpA
MDKDAIPSPPREVRILIVASKWRLASMVEQEFDRAFNEMFDELLINRWQCPRSIRSSGDALVVEDEETYRVEIAAPDADPKEITVEVSQWRLTVQIRAAQGREERTLDFSHPIDIERVAARFESGMLEVTAPKARGRKIEVR